MASRAQFVRFEPKPGKVLVTGGTGHLGANLVRRLLQEGHEVRCLVEPSGNTRALDDLDVERVVGDLRDAAAVRSAVRGCRLVFHAAAKVSTRNPTLAQNDLIFQVNVVGTKHVVDACLREGVERLCHTSSFSTIGVDPRDPSRPVDESMPFYPFLDWLPYARTKALAEHEVLKGVAEGLDAVMAVSTGIIGPNDFLPSRTGKTLVDFANGRLHGYMPGGSEFVTTDDIVEGHLLATLRGRNGHRYLISTGFLSLDDLLGLFEGVCGRKRPRLRLPVPVMAVASSVYANTVRRIYPDAPQRLTPGAIHILAMNRHADLTKARTELGFEPGDLRTAVHEAHGFFRAVGMIRA